LNRQVQVVAYADDVAIIARNKRALEENFALLEEKARDLGLEVNRSKTKFMKLRKPGEVRGEATVRLKGKEYQRVEVFKYLGSITTEDNKTSVETEERIASGNRCYYTMQNMLKSKNVSRNTKIRIYTTTLRPIVM
jgi:hypothetical protein